MTALPAVTRSVSPPVGGAAQCRRYQARY